MSVAVLLAALLTASALFAYGLARGYRYGQRAYLVQLRKVLEDGVVSDAERNTLKHLQTQYRLSDAEVQKMVDEINAGKVAKS